MWLWIKHWLDWAMNDALPLTRTRPHGQVVHTRYEKAGLALYDLPVPWNADAVVVEVLVRLPPPTRRRADFACYLPGHDPIGAESLRHEGDDRYQLLFRLPVPAASTSAEVFWKHRMLARVNVPVLSAREFVSGLRLTLPTAAVRLGPRTVAAQTFVAAQCKGLIASCVLESPTSLAPVADLGLKVVFRSERTGAVYEVPVTLSCSQLAVKKAVIAAVPPRVPRRVGSWQIAWRVGDRELAVQQVHGIPAKRFETSLRVADVRFVVGDKTGSVKLTKLPPPVTESTRLGPCFFVSSSESGMAGVCRLQVYAVVSGESRPPLLMEQDVLVTDGPTVFAPGILEAADLTRVTGFELRHKGRVLGVASLSPIPTAGLTAEGGFKPPPEFAWSNAAEDELTERLGRLMGGGDG